MRLIRFHNPPSIAFYVVKLHFQKKQNKKTLTIIKQETKGHKTRFIVFKSVIKEPSRQLMKDKITFNSLHVTPAVLWLINSSQF